jgi:hypothetical protein
MGKIYYAKIVKLHELESIDLSNRLAFLVPRILSPDDEKIQGVRITGVERGSGGYGVLPIESNLNYGVYSGHEAVLLYSEEEDTDNDNN